MAFDQEKICTFLLEIDKRSEPVESFDLEVDGFAQDEIQALVKIAVNCGFIEASNVSTMGKNGNYLIKGLDSQGHMYLSSFGQKDKFKIPSWVIFICGGIAAKAIDYFFPVAMKSLGL